MTARKPKGTPIPVAQAKPANDALTGGRTIDSFTNFAARLGVGAGNLSDAAGYSFNFITRQRVGLEAAYRGSWVVGAAVDYIADDMTSAGVSLENSLKPDEISALTAAMRDLRIWQSLASTIKWARLYGGAGAYIMIDGQNSDTPLNLDSVSSGQFKGLCVFDRWMVNPSMSEVITDLGPGLGYPKFYDVVQGSATDMGGVPLPAMRIHHSRFLRFDGLELPYQQKLIENWWGLSVIERIFDRLQAFDSTTAGAAQLVYKAYLRVQKINKFRELIAQGGAMQEAVIKQIEFTRLMQGIEGITVIDAEDEFEALSYTFTGLSDVLLQFGQQLAGAIEMPLTRLFGQSPAGLNSTGESDLRTYYDGIRKKQETHLRGPVTVLLDVLARSVLGKPLPEGATFDFRPLWQTSELDKATIAATETQAITNAYEAGIVGRDVAMKELRQSSHKTGVWSNVSDEDIADAESEPPPSELAEQARELAMNPPDKTGGSGSAGSDKPAANEDKTKAADALGPMRLRTIA